MSKTSEGSKSFVIGAFIIAASHILIKLIGAAYKIPLDRFILQTQGMGIYNSSYTIYNWLFVISTAGLPVAISKMVAEANAKGFYKETRKIFKVSTALLFFVGLIASSILFFFSRVFSNIISAPSAYLTMIYMAPSLFFVSLSSSYRGFYQGRQNMVPTAVSEVIESLSKLIFGLTLAYIAMKKFNEAYISSAWAIAGVTIGTFFSFLFLFIYNRFKIDNYSFKNINEKTSPTFDIIKRLIKISIPITLGVSVFTLTSIIDTATVMNQLKALGFEEEIRLSMYGYLNRAITLFNLPPTIISAIAISIVPAIASALAVNDKVLANKNVKSALRITMIFAVPCAAGLSALAPYIFKLLYNDSNYSFLLVVMGIAVFFVALVQVSNAILQAYTRVWVPVKNMFIGGIVKVIINILLVSRIEININGAPIGTLCCYLTVMLLNLYEIKKMTKIRYEFTDFLLKPALTGFVTAVFAVFSYNLISRSFGNSLSVMFAIIFGGVFYFISLFAFKALSKDDIILLPKGQKVLNFLERYKLI